VRDFEVDVAQYGSLVVIEQEVFSVGWLRWVHRGMK
jgi:hypothetical protein